MIVTTFFDSVVTVCVHTQQELLKQSNKRTALLAEVEEMLRTSVSEGKCVVVTGRLIVSFSFP